MKDLAADTEATAHQGFNEVYSYSRLKPDLGLILTLHLICKYTNSAGIYPEYSGSDALEWIALDNALGLR